MMRSLYSGISGLRNHQTRMDVIGNNIANVNTAGFKASRVIFQDVFSQTVSSGMGSTAVQGGTNPVQIGLGIRLSTIDVLHTRSAFSRTDNPTDLSISGDGFFILGTENAEGTYDRVFTRAGNFSIDSDGFLVASSGHFVLGNTQQLAWGIVVPASDNFVPAQIITGPNGQPIIDPENRGSGTPPVWGWVPATTNAVDADGTVIEDQFVQVQPEFGRIFTGANNAMLDLASVSNLNDDEQMGDNAIDIRGEIQELLAMDAEDPATALAWAQFTADTGLSRAMVEALYTVGEDGEASVETGENVRLFDFAVAENGTISVMANNRQINIGTLQLAVFSNPGGLQKVGNSMFVETASSGEAVDSSPGSEGAGIIQAGGLEMSNVDLASEFTDMIVTQRGFQANSRIITVSDTMLEELVNLKR